MNNCDKNTNVYDPTCGSFSPVFYTGPMGNGKGGYSKIKNFGKVEYASENPLTYAIGNNVEGLGNNGNYDNLFQHGSEAVTLGIHSDSSQLFMSQYCAQGWDGFCDAASQDDIYYGNYYPNQLVNQGSLISNNELTQGEALLRNTASRKYLDTTNCLQSFRPFDPNVADSPLISEWTTGKCGSTYRVNPSTIDNDIVMNKILVKPLIAIDILAGIFSTMKRDGTICQLKGTKLGRFFSETAYFKNRGGVGC